MCGYQDVDCWIRELQAAGWRPWRGRTIFWQDPQGNIWMGPYGAWREMVRRRAGEIR